MRGFAAIVRWISSTLGRAGAVDQPGASLDDDRTEWDRAWRAMPHRRLAAPLKIDGNLKSHGQFGNLVSATISPVPPEFRHIADSLRESGVCPVCGGVSR